MARDDRPAVVEILYVAPRDFLVEALLPAERFVLAIANYVRGDGRLDPPPEALRRDAHVPLLSSCFWPRGAPLARGLYGRRTARIGPSPCPHVTRACCLLRPRARRGLRCDQRRRLVLDPGGPRRLAGLILDGDLPMGGEPLGIERGPRVYLNVVEAMGDDAMCSEVAERPGSSGSPVKHLCPRTTRCRQVGGARCRAYIVSGLCVGSG